MQNALAWLAVFVPAYFVTGVLLDRITGHKRRLRLLAVSSVGCVPFVLVAAYLRDQGLDLSGFVFPLVMLLVAVVLVGQLRRRAMPKAADKSEA